jgi:hypothetical protein
MSEWKPTSVDDDHLTHLCPRCKNRTETLIKIDDDDGYEYCSAERCTKCRWIVDFEADEIKVKNY